MSQKQQDIVIDRALEQLSDPALRESRVARRLRETLTGAKKTGELQADELGKAATGLVEELDVPRYFAKGGGADSDTDSTGAAWLAILILLLLLAALAALADESSDVAALIQDLIQTLLDTLRGR